MYISTHILDWPTQRRLFCTYGQLLVKKTDSINESLTKNEKYQQD